MKTAKHGIPIMENGGHLNTAIGHGHESMNL